MGKLLYAEEVLELLLTEISLSRYDSKFFYNLQLTNVLTRKAITSNQADLFKKIVLKYHSQLLKKSYNSVELSELPWQLPIVQSSASYTNAIFSIQDDKLVLHCPYKNAFISEFREANLMNWNKTDRCYYSEFGLYTFKHVNDIVLKHFNEIEYSSELKEIIAQLSEYECTFVWDPTLVERNGRLYIAAISESLHEATKHIDINTDYYSLAKLTSYGIKVDSNLVVKLCEESLEPEQTYSQLMSTINHESSIEVTDDYLLIKTLHDMQCDRVIFYSSFNSNNKITDNITYQRLVESGFSVTTTLDESGEYLSTYPYDMPVFIKFNSLGYSTFGTRFASKVIQLVNSTPLEIK